MNSTRIEKDFYFHAALHFENSFYINVYDVTISFLVETDSSHEQTIAMERVTHFISNELKNSIFVHATDDRAIERYLTAGIRVCELPEEPYDQIIAMVLLQKVNAITEGRLHASDMTLASVMSDGVRYNMVIEMAEHSLGTEGFWWNAPDTSLCNCELTQDNVVPLFKQDVWDSLGLSWKEKANF